MNRTASTSRRFAALLLAILAVAAAPVPAQDGNVYDLELVVFLNEATHTSEVDVPDPERSARYNDLLADRFQRTGAVLTESAENGRLADVANRLASAGGYTVLRHVKWRQEVKVIDEAPYVDVSALGLGEDSGMRGLVRFYHSPLLYVDVLLRYRPFADPLESAATASPAGDDAFLSGQAAGLRSPQTRTWFLDEKRRLKLKELHYLDHPHLGAIIGAWPTGDASAETSQPAGS